MLMHRMLFEDFRGKVKHLSFACPLLYHPAIQDHPYVDEILDSNDLDLSGFPQIYNTSTICNSYENHIAPSSDLNRVDILAKYCNINIKNYNMYITLSPEEIEFGREVVANIDRPVVAVCPISSMNTKNLAEDKIRLLCSEIHDLGMYPLGLHTSKIDGIEYTFCGSIRQWMSVMNAVDYVISVDTSAFHLAGGLGKPVIGIFSIVNGRVYAKHYPTAEVVQGDCPWGHTGCYAWNQCGAAGIRKPCIDSISVDNIIEKFKILVSKFPIQ